MPLYIGNKEVIKVYRGIIPFCKIYLGSQLIHWASDCRACVKYGYLYNWYAATDARNIANTGWHVPTLAEARALYWGISGAGGKMKETSTTYWNSPNAGATNEYGLGLRGSGVRDQYGVFSSLKEVSYHWVTMSYGYYFLCYYGLDVAAEGAGNKSIGCGVRLVKDDDTVANYTGNDGKTYNTVKIGSKVWMTENLAETEYRDHSKISIVEDPTTWIGMLTGAMCAYNNDYTNVGCGETEPEFTEVEYGLLYNWHAVTDARNIAPAGWHVPTLAEVQALYGYVGAAGFQPKMKDIGLTYWNHDTGATNMYGFTARGCGYRIHTTGVFTGGAGVDMYMLCNNSGSPAQLDFVDSQYNASVTIGTSEKRGYSIRLIKDDSTDIGTVTDNDGNIYPTVTIGTQVWMATNLKTTKYRTGDTIPEVTDNAAWAALTTGALCAYNNDWGNV